MKNSKLHKKISIGLNLNEKEEDIYEFFEEYQDYLSSVYFSLPLGKGFYSRNELSQEYEVAGAEEKLLGIIKSLEKYKIRSEVAINIYGLSELDLNRAIEYMLKKDISPDEIVCLDEYGTILKKGFPNCELKYSFNNPKSPSCYFDSIVVGKGFLRNKKARHKIIDNGYNLVLLLNNGCSFECHYPCGDSDFCKSILKKNLKKYDLNYIYALQSFFPSELFRLLDEDIYADKYRFKISNRPLGIDFSRRAMDSYCGLCEISEWDMIKKNSENYGLYCVMAVLFRLRNEFNLDKIYTIKKTLDV